MSSQTPLAPNVRQLQTPHLPASSSQLPRTLRREPAVRFNTAAEQAMEDAMLASSSPPPETVLGKRTRPDDNSAVDADTELDEQGPSTLIRQPPPSISNVTAATLRFASKKKLRPEQRDELDVFLLDTALGRQVKLFVCVLALENKLDTIRSAAPPYKLSEELKTNINNYGVAVMLSVNISAYKGDIPRNHVLDILKRFRFDLPVGIEHDYANWEKIATYVGYSLTQSRARVKKAIKDSIATKTNIFSLAQIIVHSTPCRVTVQLCARVALMRAVQVECNGNDKYWNLIDARLQFIRDKAGFSASKIAKAFKKVLQADRAEYGAEEDYEIGDNVADDWQQRVDNVVAGTAEV